MPSISHVENALKIRRWFDAPREKVFSARTNPEELKRWWGPVGYTVPSVEIDLCVGGHFRIAMQALSKMKHRIVCLILHANANCLELIKQTINYISTTIESERPGIRPQAAQKCQEWAILTHKTTFQTYRQSKYSLLNPDPSL